MKRNIGALLAVGLATLGASFATFGKSSSSQARLLNPDEMKQTRGGTLFTTCSANEAVCITGCIATANYSQRFVGLPYPKW